MKRFAMTISLAACLVFLCGTFAMAANQVVVESKSVPPSAVGVTIGVYVTNDVDITGFVMPLEFRTLSGGAYMAVGGFSRDHNLAGRLANSPLGPAGSTWPDASITRRTLSTPNLTGSGCFRPEGGVDAWNTNAASHDGISPDAIFHAAVSTGDPNIGEDIALPAGSDAPGVPSYLITCNVAAAQGQFIVDTTCIRPANHLSFVDINTASIAPAFTAGIITVEIPPNPCPIDLAANPNPASATVGTQVQVQLSSTDAPDNNTRVYYPSRGTVDANGLWSDLPTCADVPSYVVTVEISDDAPGRVQGDCQSVQFTVNVSPQQLNISCGNVNVHWAGASAQQQIVVGGGCPPYTFAQQSGLGTTDASGLWSFDQGCGDVGTSPITVRATDDNGDFVECTFNLTVSNVLPSCAVIVPTLAPQGVETVIDLGDLAQADGDALTYTLITGTGWADEDITGDSWSATRPGADGASYTVTYSVSDGCASVQCAFDVIFENPCVAIVKEGTDSSYGQWLNGEHATVCVVAEPGAIPGDAGGYDFLICYDLSGLSFLGADGGPAGWEYFTYRTGPFGGNCGGGCPDGYIRLLSIAETNNGTPVDPADLNLDGEVLACMTFNVTSDRNFINSCLHVGFCSFDCGDNSISDASGNILWVPRDGVNLGSYYDCVGNPKPGYEIEEAISYCPGAICIAEPPDDRGDLNLNGIANEIGDVVLYTNYFIYGSSVWNPTWVNVQILASDINDDGVVLTVADLIYLIRILTGDEQPFPPGTGTGSPKVSPYANSVDVSTDVSNGAVTVRSNSSVDIGAALLVFRYDGAVGAPVLANNSGLQIRSNAANGELRVLVSQTVEAAGTRLTAGSNSIVSIPVKGNIELVESQFSDANGGLLSVNAASASVPTEYALLQNYPNPFNAGTVIPFTMTKEGEYSLTIYNVAGQVVRTFVGMGHLGTNQLEWNGRTEGNSEVATGVYFYRVSTPEFTATKKMVLIK